MNRVDIGADRQMGGKCGIHQKLVNRMGAVDGIERFGGMMMNYKVGDEVLVKAVINDICVGEVLPYEVKAADNPGCGSSVRVIYVREEDVLPAPDMTAEESWEIAKKLFADYSNAELDDIFGKGWSFPQLMEMTPHEAKSKIKAWEAEKEIKVGDEVALKDNPYKDDSKFFVTKLDKKENRISGVSGFDGGVFWGRNIMKYQKTGRHIDIDGILKQIGGNE